MDKQAQFNPRLFAATVLLKHAAEERGWTGVDLDSTLARYKGWKGHLHIGAPIVRMVARIKRWLADGKNVKIFTARISGDDGRARKAIERWCIEHLGTKLPVTNRKDKHCERIWDDRATSVVKNDGKQVKLDYHEKRAVAFLDGYRNGSTL